MGTGKSYHWSRELLTIYGGKAHLNQTNNVVFMKGDYSFRRFTCNRELIPDCSCSHREREQVCNTEF